MMTLKHHLVCACGARITTSIGVPGDAPADAGHLAGFVARLIAYARRWAFSGEADGVRCARCYTLAADHDGETWPRDGGSRR